MKFTMKILVVAFLLMPFFGLAQGAEPAAVATYDLTPGQPKYVTSMIEFSDPAGKFWPNLFVGKPSEAGQLVADPKSPVFTGAIVCDTTPQTGGIQTRRLLGELFVPGEGGRTQSPPVSFTFQTLQKLDYPAKDKKGKENARLGQAEIEGTLKLGSKMVPLKGTVEFRFEGGKEGVPTEVHCHSVALVEASELGLNQFKGPVKVRIFTMVYTRGAAPVKK